MAEYKDVRDSIKSGDLLAWSANKLTSFKDFQVQAIRVFDRTEYTHVGIAWRVADRLFVIEAVTPHVRIVPLSNELPCYHIPMEVEWTEELEKRILSYVGNPMYEYSKWEAIKAFFGWNKKGNTKLECAEFVQIIYEKAGLAFKTRATPSDVVKESLETNTTLTYIKGD